MDGLSSRENITGMRALVTGATGFIGANVVRALLERGYDVRAFVRPGADRANLDGLAVEWAEGDVRDARSVRAATAGCSLVFHIAALYAFWARPRRLIYEVNVDGTGNVLRAAEEERVERVVVTSSVAALGLRGDGRPADEAVPATSATLIGDYKRSKFLAQELALAFAHRGLPVVIVNPSFPVGPYDRKPTPTGQVIVDFLNGRMPAYVDGGVNVVAVEDVALGHVLAAERGQLGERYILGGENLTMREFFRLLSVVSGRPAPRLRLPAALLTPLAYLNAAWSAATGTVPRLTPDTARMARHRMFYDPGKAVRELGLPQTPAREALRRAVEWFRGNGYVRGRSSRRGGGRAPRRG
ncbi:MAG: NAD-dependent epimerase/dehydratase family protein [Candidatus Bipolaricaulota bacterium]